MGSDINEPDLDLFIEFILITLLKDDQPSQGARACHMSALGGRHVGAANSSSR